jgi:2-oxoglutarate ferredoxin oxidoreductase subunit delta
LYRDHAIRNRRQAPMTDSRIIIDPDRCKGCGLCIAACPHHLLQFGHKPNRQGQLPVELVANGEQSCTSCACCARSCPDVAISVFRPVAPTDRKEPT